MSYVPDRGDIIWLTFDPQAGRRPALVLSPDRYNGRVGLALVCPITSKVKGYTFEVILPEGLPINGVILSDQMRSLDWRVRQASFIAKLPDEVIAHVLAKVVTLLE
jgi:mRNA interferase MazF